jgi:hypothetical protein
LEDRIRELVAALQGEVVERRDVVSQFLAYTESLLKLPTSVFATVQAVASSAEPRWSDGSPRMVDAGLRSRARESVHADLASAGVSEPDIRRALAEFDAGRPLPVVDGEEFPRIRDWVRRFATDDLVALAVALWDEMQQGRRGVTLGWLMDRVCSNRADSPRVPDEIKQWQAETLANAAREAGLLLRSTERPDPRRSAFQDACDNPGFDFGPMTLLVGTTMKGFQYASASPQEGSGARTLSERK